MRFGHSTGKNSLSKVAGIAADAVDQPGVVRSYAQREDLSGDSLFRPLVGQLVPDVLGASS